jgi:hypothetical protein
MSPDLASSLALSSQCMVQCLHPLKAEATLAPGVWQGSPCGKVRPVVEYWLADGLAVNQPGGLVSPLGGYPGC